MGFLTSKKSAKSVDNALPRIKTILKKCNLSGELSKEKGVLSEQSICYHESRGFSYDRFLEESWIDESSCSSPSAMDDLDGTGSWISTFELNLERSELLQLKDDAYSDFSSCSCSYKRNPQSLTSSSSPSSVTTFHPTEASSSFSSEFDHDEPLFWPYNPNLYESSELGKSFLCVSPRKDKKMVVNELKSVEVKLKKTNSLSANRKNMQLKCDRRPELSQTPKKSATGWKSTAPALQSHNNSRRLPSELNKSLAQASANLFPCNNLAKKRTNSAMKETPQLKSMNKVEELPKQSLLEFEAGFFHQAFINGATIEDLVGLNEFDGYEWLSFKFSEDCFIESMEREESSQVGRETFFFHNLERP